MKRYKDLSEISKNEYYSLIRRDELNYLKENGYSKQQLEHLEWIAQEMYGGSANDIPTAQAYIKGFVAGLKFESSQSQKTTLKAA